MKWERPNIGGLVKLSLADVLYNPKTNKAFNTNSSIMTSLDGAEEKPSKDIPTGEVEVLKGELWN